MSKFNKMGFWNELTDQPEVIHHGDPEMEPEINEILPVNHE